MMKRFIWVFLITKFLTQSAKGQEGSYFFAANSKPVDKKEDAIVMLEVKKQSEKKYIMTTYQYKAESWGRSMKQWVKIKGNKNQKITYYENTFFPKRISREFEELGQGLYKFQELKRATVIRSGTSKSVLPLYLDGTVTEYYKKNGKIKSISIYKDNQLISNENWLLDGSKYIDSIFFSVDVDPVYHANKDFFRTYIMSKLAESKLNLNEFDDEIVIGLVIMETGQIQGVTALEGRSVQMNEFLISAITHLPGDWTPAKLNGSPVRYFMTLPINFIHNELRFRDVEISGSILHYDRY